MRFLLRLRNWLFTPKPTVIRFPSGSVIALGGRGSPFTSSSWPVICTCSVTGITYDARRVTEL